MPHLSIKYILGGLLIYAELLVVGLRDHICKSLIPQCNWIQTIAGCITERPWLIVATATLIAIPLYYAIEQVAQRKRFSLLRFAIFVCTSLMFFCLKEAKMPGGFALAIALSCIFVGLCVLELIRYLRANDKNIFPNQVSIENGAKGFANISKADELYNLGWGSYAKILYKKLVVTNVDEAYAVGLNAQWGYGKTTFLNEIKKNVTENEILVDFNPWLSSSPDQIVKDFFDNLKYKLREYDDQIDDDIDNYVSLLGNMNVHPVVTVIAKIWEGTSSKSLPKSRNCIQDHINKIGRKIIIVIDDLDRLEKDEIYEVLKLIRNTAKFQYLIYIVAYDRNYICATLREKGIVDPETYLYKIFQMEMLLPVFENDLIEKKLIEELKKQLEGEVQEVYLKAIEDEIIKAYQTGRAVGYFLKNFRDVKRFANMLCLEIEQIAATNIRYDVLPWGLFWLEIIHYSYEDIYLVLRNNPLKFLERVDDDGRLMLKKELEVKDLQNEHLFALVDYMFGKSTDERGINNLNSYSTYFSLRPYVDKVGWSEFITAINTYGEQMISLKMKEWLNSPEGKEVSLFTRFMGAKIGKSVRLTSAFANYFRALELWIDYKNDTTCKHYLPIICHRLVNKDICRVDMIPHIQKYFDQMINHLLEKRENCIVVMKILARLCPYDIGEETLINDNVIGKEKIEELIKRTFYKFIEGREIKVDDLCEEKSEIHRLIGCARVDEPEKVGGVPFFVFDTLLRDYFKNKKPKESASILMNTFVMNKEMSSEEGCEEDEIVGNLNNRIKKYFVSVVWYRNFLWQCVAENRETVDKYLKENRL